MYRAKVCLLAEGRKKVWWDKRLVEQRVYKTKASCFCRQFLFCVTDGVLSLRYFFFWVCQSGSKILYGKFLISLSLHTKLFLLLSRPTTVEQNF